MNEYTASKMVRLDTTHTFKNLGSVVFGRVKLASGTVNPIGVVPFPAMTRRKEHLRSDARSVRGGIGAEEERQGKSGTWDVHKVQLFSCVPRLMIRETSSQTSGESH